MDTRKMASAYRLSQWSEAVQERVSKGESIKDFCERKGISRNTYFYWQRKLREAASLLPVVNTPESGAIIPSGWAICAAEAKQKDGQMTIEIGQLRVSMGADVSPAQLEKVCRVLMRLC